MQHFRFVPVFVFALIASAACGSSESTSAPGTDDTGTTTPATALFALPASLDELSEEHFLDLPWPNDLRREADGTVRFIGMYNPKIVPLIRDYLDATKGLLTGFSPAAAIYFRFTSPIDESTLPKDPKASTQKSASAFLIDIDPKSDERGKKHPVEIYVRNSAGLYWQENTLALLPVLGMPLRPNTKYAAVVTRDVKDTSGAAMAPSADLEEVLGTKESTDAHADQVKKLSSAIAELEKNEISADTIAHLTVFTTNDPTEELFRVADSVKSDVEAPTVQSLTAKEQTADYDVYEGVYGPSPNYQAGNVPYEQVDDGGSFEFDKNGKPKLQNTFDPRFVLVVPKASKCPMPANGYPISLNAHGTGGDYRSVIRGSGNTGTALAQKCVASIGVDQIFHGTRPGAPAEDDPTREGDIQLLFFNLNNPKAARTNNRQSAIDVIQEARLFTETKITVPAATSRTSAEIKFDGSNIVFFGHSQGGLNGPLYLAADSSARGGVLSGAGSVITIAFLEKTSPSPSVAGAVKAILRVTEDDELNLFHPAINMAQALIDTTDPIHYMRSIATAPRNGGAAKSILMTEGVNADGTGDTYAPPHGIEVGSVALGIPRLLPGTKKIREAAYAGIEDVEVPADGLSGNIANGTASGGIAQFAPADRDGHFVVFDVPEARELAAGFLRNLVDDPKGKIPKF